MASFKHHCSFEFWKHAIWGSVSKCMMDRIWSTPDRKYRDTICF